MKYLKRFNENQVIDEILDKISNGGVDSLTSDEKSILDEYSKTGKSPSIPKHRSSGLNKPRIDPTGKPNEKLSSDIEVFIERYEDGQILLDFIDESEYQKFLKITKGRKQNESMILVTGFKQRGINEGENYFLPKGVVEMWVNEGRISDNSDSYLIGYEVNMEGCTIRNFLR